MAHQACYSVLSLILVVCVISHVVEIVGAKGAETLNGTGADSDIKVSKSEERQEGDKCVQDVVVNTNKIQETIKDLPCEMVADMKLVTKEGKFAFGNPQVHDVALFSSLDALVTIKNKGAECYFKTYPNGNQDKITTESCEIMKSATMRVINPPTPK